MNPKGKNWAVPDLIWAPLTGAALTMASGFIGLAAHQLWLVPSLAPTYYLYSVTPHLPSARLYNTLMGHFLAMGMGFLAVLVTGASHLPSALILHSLMPSRIWASGIAIFLTLFLQLATKAVHAPAAATALLISLGLFEPSWADARTITFGVLITAFIGELFRYARLSQPGQK